MSKLVSPLNFKAWIEENRHLLKPPVGNKVVWKDGDFIVMVVGGPNSRKDYHYNETPEFFYQVEGDIVLKIIDNGEPKDVHIKEGDIYLLPPKVPHSPQRGANTVGLVIEYKRPEGMKDALLWFCESCTTKLYEEDFALENIEIDMPKIFDKYYSDLEKRTCQNCGATMEPPKKVKIED
ncbi:3-hydroxyanthranilate 3,4-dioxygenase [Aestuariibaculum suncheonense]|uniref:3-hydroxyanthranilate 3,4-dioxygenase n=1 Tax=Aestuariibaculum suncheonense TaxID=1028745 RepID=A0A8J6Q9N6_9FLAO|nr:3-hydroxyanthranilate 3,4-dioxygenase [Aestuariibaculum suncheonense]MBD0836419.1 3-hydroxyanthranilate 3,4-dioxygenase [Aestuariibaculum suncheonense]